MRQYILSFTLCFALVLGLQEEVGGERGESRAEGYKSRLIYWFSLQVPEQCQRAGDLETLTHPYRRQLEIAGVVRDAEGGAPEPGALDQFRRGRGLSYPLLTVAEAASDPLLLPALASLSAGSEDYVLLLGPDGQRVAAGPGQKLFQVLGALAPVATDVDESTWGKIKELFQ